MRVEKRYSNFELLRIVSILLITLHHMTLTVGINSTDMYVRLWGQFFYIGGKVGVNCFVLIGAYFLCDKDFKLTRIISLHRKVWVYSIIGLIVGIAGFTEYLSLINIAKSVFPILFVHYWFLTSYVGLLIVAPLINMVLSKISRKEHISILLVLFILYSVIPTFTAQTIFNSNLGWFIFLYFVSAYIKKYGLKWSGKYFILIWMFIWGMSVVFTLLEPLFPFLREGTNFFTGMYIIPQFLNTLSIFMAFKNMRIENGFVNFCGKHTLACYLLQSNCILINFRVILFEYVFGHTNVYLYPLVAIITCLMILIASVIIDAVIDKVLSNRIIQIVDNKLNNIYLSINSMIKIVLEKGIRR